MPNRKPISNKLRFDVFKRDSFTCQYCGNTPPEIILEVDHINPVSNGGDNEIDNLITSCFECNRGKAGSLLSSMPESLEKRMLVLEEKQLQWDKYYKLIKKLNKIKYKHINEVAEIYTSYFEDFELTDAFRNTSIKRFLNDLDIETVKDAMHLACTRIYDSDDSINYFCGICWNKIRDKSNG